MKKLFIGLVIPIFILALSPTPAMANSSTVLSFDDLTHTDDSCAMTNHNPYNGVSFYGLFHRAKAYYATAHSTPVYLLNGFGLDSNYITFDSPVTFEGAWVAQPNVLLENRAIEFWFEGYLDGTLVGDSASTPLSLTTTMKWHGVNFGGPVDKVVFRRTPSSGNGMYVIDDITFNTTTSVDISVDIDIKPGGNPNSINLRSKGVVTVAILTTDMFDAAEVDPTTVELVGSLGSASPIKWKMVDIPEIRNEGLKIYEGDGDQDLLLYFKTQDLADSALDPADTEVTLTGGTYDGIHIKGIDVVRILAKGPHN